MSEVIITAEMKEDAKKCNGSMACGVCKMPREFHLHPQMCIEALASLPGVWDEADANIDRAEVVFILNGKSVASASYIRTLPKSLEDEISGKYLAILQDRGVMRPYEAVLKEMLKEYNERQGGKTIEVSHENQG